MTALGAETRRVSDELLAREAGARRTLVLFAMALAMAVGAVLGILGAGSMGMFEISAASLRLPVRGNLGGLAGLAGLCAAARSSSAVQAGCWRASAPPDMAGSGKRALLIVDVQNGFCADGNCRFPVATRSCR